MVIDTAVSTLAMPKTRQALQHTPQLSKSMVDKGVEGDRQLTGKVLGTIHFGHTRKIYHTILFSEPPRIVPFSFGSDVIDEGAFAQLTCSVSHGDEPMTVSWSLKGDSISSEPAITTTMVGTRTSLLIISSVGYRHSGLYTCNARNKAGAVSHSAILKVNGDFI